MSHAPVHGDDGPKALRRADQYDAPDHDYVRYWAGREYEHAAEELAVVRLIGGRRFGHAVDVGGGFGRLSLLLEQHADRVTLVEPSRRQLDAAAQLLASHPRITCVRHQAADLPFETGSVDLVTFVRVLHHIPDPAAELREIARVLAPDGLAVIEFANYAHAVNRIKHWLSRRPLPTTPVDLRSTADADGIPFVNHHPDTVVRQLAEAGLVVERALSVSNLRSSALKRWVPGPVLLRVESALQPRLAGVRFGPSVFVRARPAAG